MDKKLKYAIMAILLCGVWLLLPLTPVLLSDNTDAQAASALWNGTVATGFAGGTGTESDPYLISTAEQLAYFSQRVNSGSSYAGQYIKLTQDILLNEMNDDGVFVSTPVRKFTSIGKNNRKFNGTFDGNNMKIIGLYIEGNANDQGLFGFADADSTIKNVGVSGFVKGNTNVGGVAGITRGMVESCYSECMVSGSVNVGGVVGLADQHSYVKSCYNTGTVSGTSKVGGVIGDAMGVVQFCYNTGSVSGTQYVGGVVGLADQLSLVKNCYNVGAVTGTQYVGGVAGLIDDHNVDVLNNYSAGTVTGTQYVGGVAGFNDNGTVSYNYYDSYMFSGGGINGYDVDMPESGYDDGAVGYSSNTMHDISVVELLNTNNPDGPVWILDTPVMNDGYPILGVHAPLSVVSFKIAAGKHYNAATLATGTPVTVTADSVFTVGYSVSYADSCNLAAQTLGLANNGAAVQLPTGTSIIMLAEGSYYYLNLAAPASKVSLGEFIKMGSVTAYYTPATQAQPGDIKDFLFIFDFTNTVSQIPAGACRVELLTAGGEGAGSMPMVTVAGVNTYSITANGEDGALHVNFSANQVTGYDYKTDGKYFAYEFSLEQEAVAVPWPIGTKINGAAITSTLPYVFTAASFGDTAVSVDLADCINPLSPGNYDVSIKAYACTAVSTPRDGYILASGATTLAVAAPAQYAVRVSAATRVFDHSAAAIPVVFDIETMGSGTVRSTLQKKYGSSYVNTADQTDLPVSISGGSTTLTIPAGYANGTYRFVLTLYDANNNARALDAESIIIK